MTQSKHILLVRTDIQPGMDHIALRDYILESVGLGVLILGHDDTYEIVELPALGGVEVQSAVESERPAAEPQQDPEPTPAGSAPSGQAEEKREIIRRLKEYRRANGLGALEKLSAKTAHQKGRRLSAETLRYLCADGAPKMPMSDWRKISRALDLLEQNKGKEDVHERTDDQN